MGVITCRHCGKQKEVMNYHSVGNATECGFEVVYDISNGLTMIYLCQECSSTIRENVRIIEDILNKSIGDINLMNFSIERKGELE